MIRLGRPRGFFARTGLYCPDGHLTIQQLNSAVRTLTYCPSSPRPLIAPASFVLHSRFRNGAFLPDKGKPSHKQAELHTSRRHIYHRHYVAFCSPFSLHYLRTGSRRNQQHSQFILARRYLHKQNLHFFVTPCIATPNDRVA